MAEALEQRACARERAESALRESERRYRLLAERSTDVVWTTDLALRFTYVSPSIERLGGYTVEEVLRQTMEDILAPGSREDARRLLTRELEPARAADLEARWLEAEVTRKDGSTVWTESSLTFLRDAAGAPTGILGVTRDITERRHAEERLRLAERLTMLGGLVAGVAHELNNPLAVVAGHAQILARSPDLPPAGRRKLELIHDQAMRAAKVVKNLLVFAGQRAPERATVRVADLVDRALELLAYPLRTSAIEVTRDVPGDLPAIAGDRDLLLQVFVNLLGNATQALAPAPTPRRIAVTGRRHGDRVQIVFADTGPGIPRDVQARIFDPFFTTRPLGQGTGLGLSVCYGIVGSHGGDLHVQSAEGRGASFIVELPIGAPGMPPPPGAPRPPVTGKRILVVDDEPGILGFVHEMLTDLGHTAQTAVSGRTALDRLSLGEAYDAILLDLKMPDMDGMSCYARLCATRPEDARKVIFMTGDLVSADSRTFLDASQRLWITKPFASAELERVLAGHFAPDR
jgi:two-component system NtrC family sensor kinase